MSAFLAAAGARRVEERAAAGPWLRPPWARVLREVLGEVRGRLDHAPEGRHAVGPCLHPVRAATLRLGPPQARSDRLAAAERELARVHLAELAFLLREASRLRCQQPPDVAAEGSPADGLAVRACREGLTEALACARRDELSLAVSWCDLARACVDAPPKAWPSASRLARAALEVEPCEEGRAELARALLEEGDPAGASRALAAALLTCASPRRGARLLEELAGVEARLGHRGRARTLRGFASRAREVA